MKKYIKIISGIVLITLLLMLVLNTNVFADPITNPGGFKPQTNYATSQDNINFRNKVNSILGYLKAIGFGLSVIVLGIIGIKYMTSSVEGKAEYKERIIPYIIGVVLLVAIPQILDIVFVLVTNAF